VIIWTAFGPGVEGEQKWTQSGLVEVIGLWDRSVKGLDSSAVFLNERLT